jgi:hypothetical protein
MLQLGIYQAIPTTGVEVDAVTGAAVVRRSGQALLGGGGGAFYSSHGTLAVD